MIGYFIRRRGDVCAVISLHPGNREDVVKDGITLPEAESLCAMKMDELRGPAAPEAYDDDPGPRESIKPRRDPRQLALKF